MKSIITMITAIGTVQLSRFFGDSASTIVTMMDITRIGRRIATKSNRKSSARK